MGEWISRPDRFCVAFVLASAGVSFAGEPLFFSVGAYSNRAGYSRLPYLAGLTFFVCILAGSVSLVNAVLGRMRDYAFQREIRTSRHQSASEATLAYWSVACSLVLFLPVQAWYLSQLFSAASAEGSLDAARIALQTTIPGVHRTFWYGSASVGLGLLVREMIPGRVPWLGPLMALEGAALALYGSKYLLIMPIVGWWLTRPLYRGYRWSIGKLLGVAVAFPLIIFTATLYTNYRSFGAPTFTPVDVFAVLMPEQRDGAFLMARASDGKIDSNRAYGRELAIAGLVALTNKALVEGATSHDLLEIVARKESLKGPLGYSFVGTPREGMIADAFLGAGWAGLVATSLVIALLLALSYLVMFRWARGLIASYTAGVTFFNILWTFNSTIPISLPFAGIILYWGLGVWGLAHLIGIVAKPATVRGELGEVMR
jgi:hypothetical protein